MIARRFTLLLGLLLALPGTPQVLLAATLGKDVPLELEEAWQKNPQDVELGLTLLRYYLKQQDNPHTLALARQLYAMQPGNTEVLKALVVTLLATDDTDAALEQAERLTQLQANSPDAWYLLGLAYIKKSDNASAHRALERAIALDPINFLLPLETEARLYLREQKYKEALKIARTLQTRFPALPAGYQLEGDISSRQQDFIKAATAYQAAYRKAPSAALALSLARAQWQGQKPTAAVQSLRDWLAAHPEDTPVRTQLVTYLEQLQRPAEAIAEYERLLEKNPNDVDVLNNLAWLYQKTGNPRALPSAERAAQLVPDRADVADTLGWILIQNNRLQRGMELLQRAAAQVPDNRVVRYHLAVAQAKAGNTAEARQALQALLDSGEHFEGREEAGVLLKTLKQP